MRVKLEDAKRGWLTFSATRHGAAGRKTIVARNLSRAVAAGKHFEDADAFELVVPKPGRYRVRVGARAGDRVRYRVGRVVHDVRMAGIDRGRPPVNLDGIEIGRDLQSIVVGCRADGPPIAAPGNVVAIEAGPHRWELPVDDDGHIRAVRVPEGAAPVHLSVSDGTHWTERQLDVPMAVDDEGGMSGDDAVPGADEVPDGDEVPWLDLADPDPDNIHMSGGVSTLKKVRSDLPLFRAGGPTKDDVAQGALGNCYFICGLLMASKFNPEALQRSLVANDDGTFTYHFPDEPPITVDDELWVREDGQPMYASGAGVKWPMILEKIFAQRAGTYAALGEGGRPGMVYQALFGAAGNRERMEFLSPRGPWKDEPADVAARLAEAIAAGHATGCGTYDDEALYDGVGLVGPHAYLVLAVSEDGTRILLENPWQEDHAGFVDGEDDGTFWISAEDFVNCMQSYTIMGGRSSRR